MSASLGKHSQSQQALSFGSHGADSLIQVYALSCTQYFQKVAGVLALQIGGNRACAEVIHECRMLFVLQESEHSETGADWSENPHRRVLGVEYMQVAQLFRRETFGCKQQRATVSCKCCLGRLSIQGYFPRGRMPQHADMSLVGHCGSNALRNPLEPC
eukprot:5518718-Amphidinium_carterae.4